MATTRLIGIALLPAAIALAPQSAMAEVFKWIGADGSVNYGDAPPPGARNARALPKDAGSLSIVPGLSKEEKDRLREREDQLRLQRLEREVEDLRARELARQYEYAQPEVIYSDVYVPAYGYGYGRPFVRRDHRHDDWRGKPRPDIPKPKPPIVTPLQEPNVSRAPVGAFSRRL